MARLRFLWIVVLCSCAPRGAPPALIGPRRALAEQQLGAGRFEDARRTCTAVLRHNPDDCAARYCELIAETLLFVDQLNSYVLPRYRREGRAGLSDLIHLWQMQRQLDRATRAADETSARRCELTLGSVPLLIGDRADPVVEGEVRGTWTERTAHTLGAILYAFRYVYANVLGHPKVPPPPPGEVVPGLPDLLERMRLHLKEQDRLLSKPESPTALRGGIYDRDGDGLVSAGDDLLIDIFRPGTNERIFDFTGAGFVHSESLPRRALTKTTELPRARCRYQRWHIDTLLRGPHVGGSDGLSFAPDGQRLVLPMKKDGRYQIHVVGLDGKDPRCLTCGSPGSNDGVRWQPGGDALLFISNRDHAYAQGGANGGVGQELYVMRSDGSRQVRLTRSHSFATNYHANWSADGRRIVWGSTEGRTWDVMIADYVDDATGPHLGNVRRLTHDTTWWETHGFSADGRAVIATNTRAGFLSPDLYAVDIASGQLTRLTDDPGWDEHAHLSPDGRKLAWISGRWRPASMLRLADGALWPLYDFFWIVPGIFFEIQNHPAGYATELTLMDADGENVQRLTFENEIVADNEWSPDGRRIVFRQQQPRLFGAGRVRVLTFDDCE
jgi:TolB protein